MPDKIKNKKYLANKKYREDLAYRKSQPGYKPRRGKKDSGCYIATAVYGSYDCPQVWTLRRYRDETLANSWFGRLFIRIYYTISPSVVRAFRKTKCFNRIFQFILDKKVQALNANGVSDKPYKDKNW